MAIQKKSQIKLPKGDTRIGAQVEAQKGARVSKEKERPSEVYSKSPNPKKLLSEERDA